MESLTSIKDGFVHSSLMRVITVATKKGGAAKSTTTLCLAVCAVLAGYRAAIIDLDTQESALSWGFAVQASRRSF